MLLQECWKERKEKHMKKQRDEDKMQKNEKTNDNER